MKKFTIIFTCLFVLIVLFINFPDDNYIGNTTYIYTDPKPETRLTEEEFLKGIYEYEAILASMDDPVFQEGLEVPPGEKRVFTKRNYEVLKTFSVGKQSVSEKEFSCLAKNIFHEAGVESIRGKLAVGTVTMNRLKDGRWGNSICSVVFSKAQFSWTLSSKKISEVPVGVSWEESKAVAQRILNGERSLNSNVLFYHAHYVKPVWAAKMTLVKTVDTHHFYK